MSEHEGQTKTSEWSGRLSSMPFVKIFQGFRSAVQPGKLMLALAGVIMTFLVGVVMDRLSWSKVTVEAQALSANQPMVTELDIYVSSAAGNRARDFRSYLEQVRQSNDQAVKRVLMAEPLRLDEKKAEEEVEDGEALEKIEDEYKGKLGKALKILEERFEQGCQAIEDEYKGQERKNQKADLKRAYLGMAHALLDGRAHSQQVNQWGDLLFRETVPGRRDADMVENKQKVLEAESLARGYQVARAAQGRGIFATMTSFQAQRFHQVIAGMVWQRNFGQIKQAIGEMAGSLCWLFRLHWLYGVIFTVIFLAIWSVVGGALCRMAALHVARDERIGPLLAVRFSLKKFASFFSAPLIPLGIILAIFLVTALISWLGAIPGLGEILAAVLLPLALMGGFVMALITVGVLGGLNLMYPTVAVEGSDSFDAISRSFSYVFARPWRMGFYSLVAAVYGAICYLFVRFFAFILLGAVHCSVGLTMNFDGSSYISQRGKLDAIWPMPTWSNLNPQINWSGLNGTETVAAFVIAIWVLLMVGLIIAFLVSFYYSTNTVIYFLLRQRVDATDIEDVYVEQEVEELVAEEKTTTPAPESAQPAESESSAESSQPGEKPQENDGPEKPNT